MPPPAGTPIRAVMLDRLGPLVWHRTPALAMAVLDELFETAALWRGCAPRPHALLHRTAAAA
jgi:3-dehydro-4-phosphotetronate decarboxylase